MKLLRYLSYLCLFLICTSMAYASNPIVIKGIEIIDRHVVYDSVTLDLSSGRFLIKNNGELVIKNSNVFGEISPTNPYFITIEQGRLILDGNSINAKTKNIQPKEKQPASYALLKLIQGDYNINNNKFSVATAYTTRFIDSDIKHHNSGLILTNNFLHGFHQGIYLYNTEQTQVTNNIFQSVSFWNVVLVDSNCSRVSNNTFKFSGGFAIGDAIYLADSSNVTIDNNNIFSGACYGMQVTDSENVTISNNNVCDGITYAVYFSSILDPRVLGEEFLDQHNYRMQHKMNTRIIITNNYFGQNRYGIAGNNIDNIIVANNYFVQRFSDSSTRKKFTNNSVLFSNIKNLQWSQNWYKEAYTQEPNGDNSRSSKFVVFPVVGGVVLN